MLLTGGLSLPNPSCGSSRGTAHKLETNVVFALCCCAFIISSSLSLLPGESMVLGGTGTWRACTGIAQPTSCCCACSVRFMASNRRQSPFLYKEKRKQRIHFYAYLQIPLSKRLLCPSRQPLLCQAELCAACRVGPGRSLQQRAPALPRSGEGLGLNRGVEWCCALERDSLAAPS